MSIYSDKHKFIFIHIPKNAGSTFVQNYTDGKRIKRFEILNEELGYDRDPVYGNHMTYQIIKNLVDHNSVTLDYDNYFKFCVVRNPWERMVSLYQHRMRKIDKTFQGKPRNSAQDKEDLLKGFNHWLLHTRHVSDTVLTKTPQLHWITDANGNIIADKIINIQNYDEELDMILKRLKVPRQKRKDFNRSKKDSSSYHEVYSEESKKHIEKYFASDIKEFGFTF